MAGLSECPAVPDVSVSGGPALSSFERQMLWNVWENLFPECLSGVLDVFLHVRCPMSVWFYHFLNVSSTIRVTGCFSPPVQVYPRICVGPGVLEGLSLSPVCMCIHLSDSL